MTMIMIDILVVVGRLPEIIPSVMLKLKTYINRFMTDLIMTVQDTKILKILQFNRERKSRGY